MKTIATLQADFDVTPLGTRSRLADEIHGVTVLRRTVERLARVKAIDGVYVLCPTGQFERCADALRGTGAVVKGHDAGTHPWAPLVRTARKWSLDSWRGGIGGTTCFDSYTDCRLLSGLLDTVEADAVLSAPPASPLLDPALAEAMIRHRRTADEDIRIVFTQAPPGLAGILLDADVVHEIKEKGTSIGWVFSYKPDSPERDLTLQACCYDLAGEARYASGRVVVDTDRAFEAVTGILAAHADPDAACVGDWLQRRERDDVEPLPREVEIELTTDDPYPDALLHARGDRVPRRGPLDPEIVGRVAADVSRYDDALIVLGGFGDPLRHPRFVSILEAIRSAPQAGRRVYGLAVRTTAAELTDEQIEAMITHEVDVLQVSLDAWTPQTYARLQSPSDPSRAKLDVVLARLDALGAKRRAHESVQPLTLPDMVKSRANVHELDDFHDGWLRRGGAVSISGPTRCAGTFEDLSVTRIAPSTRSGCRRIRSRCMVLADGRVVTCDQDVRGGHALGSLHEASLESLWQSAAFHEIRSAHRAGRFDPTLLCARCDDWHRP